MPSSLVLLSPEPLPFPFLGLPLELRRQIYQYCLIGCEPIELPRRFAGPYPRPFNNITTSLLLVSKQVSLEATEVLFHENTFSLELDWVDKNLAKKKLTETYMQRIQKIQLVIHPNDAASCHMDPYLWPPILANLTLLSIVVEQPSEHPPHPNYPNLPTYEEELEDWTKGFERILEFVTRYLKRSCVVEVDDDEERETKDLMRKYFPWGYTRVEPTKAGNWVFWRIE